MILGIDIGNTSVSIGAFSAEYFQAEHRVPVADAGWIEHSWRTSKMSRWGRFEVVLLSSVRPSVEAEIVAWVNGTLRAPLRRARTDFPIPLALKVNDGDKVGVDRLLAAFAAHRRAGGAAIAVTIGTAITVNAVNEAGEFLGGAIGPGVGLSAEALARACEKLPRVTPIQEPRVIAKDTEAAIRAALFHGFGGFVERLIAGAAEEMGARPPVFATGGDALLIASALRGVTVVPHLVLEGLVKAYLAAEPNR